MTAKKRPVKKKSVKKSSPTRTKRLPQIITDLKRSGLYQHVAQPDGRLHPNDERALLEGCTYDLAAGDRVTEFFATLLCIPWPQTKPLNEWERYWIARCQPQFNLDIWQPLKPFVPLRWWHERVLSRLFGWKRADGRRRFQKGFVTTAKKSGKSSTLAGLPLYMMLADGELDAETYAAATVKDQAGIIYKKVEDMLRRSPHLRDICKPIASKKRVSHSPSGSTFDALSSDVDGSEGKNPHLLLVDELHAWRNRAFFESLMYGDIQRVQPLFLMITTAGDDPESVGFEEYDFARALLDPDDPFYSMDHFAYIAEAGRDLSTGKVTKRKWDDPAGWPEANPSILEGIGSIEKLQSKCDEAKQSPRKRRAFIRYINNNWLFGMEDTWLDVDKWAECAGEIGDHDGDACWAGLDLSSVNDFTALAIAWHGEDDVIDLKLRFWLPEEGVAEKEHRWRVPLQEWIEQGWIETTPGATVNYGWIRKAISGVTGESDKNRDAEAIAELYELRELAYDRYNGHKLIETELAELDGITIAEHGQGYLGMSPPCKEFESRVIDGRLRHEGSPVMRWMITNCVVDEDPAGNIKPNKKKSRQKIDGVTAAVMAVGRAVNDKPKPRSRIGDRGIFLI